MTDSVLAKIKFRVMELMIRDDMPRAKAMHVAVKEFGHAELIKSKSGALPNKTQALPTDGQSNVREELFQRIMAIKSRLPQGSPPVSSEGGSASDSLPTPKPHSLAAVGRVARYLFKGDDEPAAKPIADKPKLGPSSTYSEVYIGRSNRELIPDSEFPAGLIDTTTQNWRNQQQNVFKPENEINPLDSAAVEKALARQQTFLRVIK